MQIFANKRTVVSMYRGIAKTVVAAGSLSLFIMADAVAAEPNYSTAADLMKVMNEQQQYLYISGIMAGLSTARYVKDGNDTGSACIDRWFHDTAGVKEKIYAAFARFGDKSPSAILYALVSKECGK